MAIDARTRFDGVTPAVDAVDVLDHTLPELLATRRDLLPDQVHRALVVDVGDRSWTFRQDGDRYEVVSGDVVAPDQRRARLRTDPDQLADLFGDLVTPIGLMTAGTLDQPEGQIGHLLDWWLVWRAALDDRPVHRPGMVDLPERLDRSFTLDDDPDECHEFLAAAGFLHLRGVFDPGEMAAISAEMDAAAPSYEQGDGRSWWATQADGTDRLVRMQGFEQRSPAAASLLEDDRFVGLGALGRSGHRHAGLPGNRVEALFKPLDVVAGISDIPWHKDCSLGRHSYQCCSLTVGVSVTGGGETSGQLRVIAGSHRALIWPSLLDTSTLDLPDLALPTETGDVTVHLSCTLHRAQPPTTRERRVMYTSFGLPPRDPGAYAAAQRRLLDTARERAPLTQRDQATSPPTAPG